MIQSFVNGLEYGLVGFGAVISFQLQEGVALLAEWHAHRGAETGGQVEMRT